MRFKTNILSVVIVQRETFNLNLKYKPNYTILVQNLVVIFVKLYLVLFYTGKLYSLFINIQG